MGRRAHLGIACGLACAIALGGGTAALADVGRADAAAPSKASISSVTAGVGSVTVKVRKCKGARGYQYQVARDPSFAKSAKKAKTSKTSYKFAGLAQGAKWYARARGYSGSTYGKWSAFRTVKTKRARTVKPVAKYRYHVKFLYQPMAYNEDKLVTSGWPCYIETDNPDPRSFRIVDTRLDKKSLCHGGMDFCDDDSGDYDDLAGYGRVDITDKTEPWYDPDNESTHFHAVKVPGGYAGHMSFSRPGTYAVKIAEKTKDGEATVDVGSITAEDQDACDDEAIDRIVAKVCDRSLPKGDQMQQVADYIRDHSYYGPQGLGASLFVNYGYLNSNLETYAAGGMCVLNSGGSGATLAQIGKRMGYPLKSLYWTDENGNDYPRIDYYDPSTAPEWASKHYLAYSKADDRYFNCCPYENTGKAYIATFRDADGKIPPFDFRGYKSYVEVK